MLINKVLFIHIPKTAGTSMEFFLGNAYGYTDIYIDRCIKGLEPDNILDLGNDKQHLPIKYYEQILDQLEFIFTIVRHPYSRLLSAYSFFKIFVEHGSNLSIKQWFMDYKIDNKNNIESYNYHLLPQHWYIENSNIRIYKYEMLKYHIHHIRKVLQINKTIPFPHIFKTDKYIANINDIDSILFEVNNYYKQDFELFNYTMRF